MELSCLCHVCSCSCLLPTLRVRIDQRNQQVLKRKTSFQVLVLTVHSHTHTSRLHTVLDSSVDKDHALTPACAQVLNTMLAAFMFWDASRNKMGQTNWGHWFADGGFLVLNVIFGDATLMNVIEFFRPFDVRPPSCWLPRLWTFYTTQRRICYGAAVQARLAVSDTISAVGV
eukprot:1561774-Rhodomonas_salina.4